MYSVGGTERLAQASTQTTTEQSDAPVEPIIAVIDHDETQRNLLLRQLTQHGYRAWGTSSAELFYQRLLTESVHIILFDLNSSLQPCFEAIAPIGERQEMGLIAFSEGADLETERQSLQAGADYYLPKPIDLRMLEATLTALWRRMDRTSLPQNNMGLWQLSPKSSELIINNQTRIRLSHQEYDFLEHMMAQPNTVIEKEALHQALFPDYEEFESHRISVMLNRLRIKIKETGHRLPIRALYGRGLVFSE
jgi:DNA-binding response OmpR family regulator